MTPDRFRQWRKALGLKQKDAADRLGLKKRMIQYYEKGDRDGRPV
ncbi:MAG: helix-turn-helix transcriptional regulator, partial [Alphaproteobacteria bacterium]|nr:helix-turn-helix transcriptional regulator [Alphaproteobacteria bacterium]